MIFDIKESTNSDINVVLCIFNSDPILSASKILKLFKSKLLRINLILVLNNEYKDDIISNDFYIVKGSNSCLDISAYYEGLKFLTKINLDKNFTIVCNDNIFFKHNFTFSFSSILEYQNIALDLLVPSIIGYRTFYSSICLTNPWSNSSSFLPTYFFALNSFGVNQFLYLYENTLYKGVLLNEYDYVFANNLVPFNLKNLIFAHLKNSNSPISWHGLVKYSVSKELIMKKMNSVFFEHYLSGVFGKEGAIIYLNTSRRYVFKQFFKDLLSRKFNFFR